MKKRNLKNKEDLSNDGPGVIKSLLISMNSQAKLELDKLDEMELDENYIPVEIEEYIDMPNECLTGVYISGIPSGTMLSSGKEIEDSLWDINIHELTDLKLILNDESKMLEDMQLKVYVMGLAHNLEQEIKMIFDVLVEVEDREAFIFVGDLEDKYEVKKDLGTKPCLSLYDYQEEIIDIHDGTFDFNTDSYAVDLKIDCSLPSTENDELLFNILNLPNNFSLSSGTKEKNGNWVVPKRDAESLRLFVPGNYHNHIEVDVTARYKDDNEMFEVKHVQII